LDELNKFDGVVVVDISPKLNSAFEEIMCTRPETGLLIEEDKYAAETLKVLSIKIGGH
jgi:hypothetical protein